MTNIYAPPSSELGAPPEEKIPRPVSLFLLQAVATVFALLTALVVAMRVFILLRQGSQMRLAPDVLWFAVVTAICVLSIALVIGLQRRSKIARFAGLIGISLPIWGALYYWAGLRPSDDSAQVVGRAGGTLVMVAPFIYWGYAFGFGRKARVYFR